ncbi:sensor histidine kinase [Pedobacter sp.]|uniref:sensor histidine kinase n=1 Tax=Pedobacter sp. TaxID=1411316 RepID=UPI003D7FD544
MRKTTERALLVKANQELAFQNEEKENRAAELVLANQELAFQHTEKENRAIELAHANEDLKNAEKQIVELNRGLEQKVIERTAQLEMANKELEAFSYSVSHDLRAPLRAINGFTEILVEDYLDKMDGDAKYIMDEIIANSKKMGELIDNLLEFSRVGKQQVNLSEIDTQAMLNSIIKDLKQQEPSRKIIVKIHPLPPMKADKNMIRQVMINLLSNAFKYTNKREFAKIEIGSYEEGDKIVYYVKDNGAGFDMKYYDKLYGVFQRLHSSVEFDGTGVGLAIIKRIINKHNGNTWATGIEDEGACFFISLPGTTTPPPFSPTL